MNGHTTRWVAGTVGLLLATGCLGSSSGGGAVDAGTRVGDAGATGGPRTPPQRAGSYPAPTQATAGACPRQTTRCAGTDLCCATGNTCALNTNNQYGCQEDYCCFGCGNGTPCGGGCCTGEGVCSPSTAENPCSTGTALCCATAEPQCPADVAATCPNGTYCGYNHSTRACSGRPWVCYSEIGTVGCPGDVLCPDGAAFCVEGTECAPLPLGICPSSTPAGCCCLPVSGIGEGCSAQTACRRGSSCVANNHCADSDPDAGNVCYGPCFGDVDCGNYCCAPDFPVCQGDCGCGQ